MSLVTSAIELDTSNTEATPVSGTTSKEDGTMTKTFNSHSDVMLSSLSRLKRDGSFCDVTITVGELQIKVHRTVLASMSKYFEAMFLHETKESESGVINFTENQPEIIVKCIDFIYSGKVEMNMEDVRLILDVAEMMELHGLSELCVEFLAESVNISTCAEVISLCHSYQKDSLRLPIRQFLIENLAEFIKSQDFLALDADSVEFCLELLQEGNEKLEVSKWEAIISWVQKESEKREDVLPKLFSVIDLSSLSSEFIKSKILTNCIIKTSNQCLERISEFCLGNEEAVPKKRRKMMTKCFARNMNSSVIVQYDVMTKRWSPFTTFPCKISVMSDFISHRGHLFIGTSGGIYRYANDTWVSEQWRTVKTCNRPYERQCTPAFGFASARPAAFECNEGIQTDQNIYCRCVGSGDFVYVITKCNVVECDILSCKFVQYQSSIGLGDGFFVAASDRKIYAMGGEATNRSVTQFDLKTKEIYPICRMLTPRTNGHAIWVFGKVYAFGGNDWPSTVEYYEPSMDIWTLVPNLTISRFPASVFLGDKLYLIGGNTEADYETVDLGKFKVGDNVNKLSLKGCQCCGTGFQIL